MKLSHAIGLTVGLLLVSAFLPAVMGTDPYFLLGVTSAVGIAWDSARLGLREYRTRLAWHPIGLGVAVFLLWPLMFPAYLYTRYRVMTGQLEKGPSHTNLGKCLLAGAACLGLLLGLVWVGTRDFRDEWLPIAQQLSSEVGVPVTINVQDEWRVVVTLPTPQGDDTYRRDLAFQIAQHVHSNRSPELTAVAVQYQDVQKRGPVTVTTQNALYEWTYQELRSP